MFSLRRTLAVRHSVTMFLALLVIGIWAEYGAEVAIRRELDRGLRAALGLETAALAAGHPIAFQQQWLSTDRFIQELNRFVVVRDTAGRIVQTNVSAAATLPSDSAAMARARRGERVWTTLPWGDDEIRTVFAPAPPGTPAHYQVVQVAASLQPMNRTAGVFLALTLGTVAVATLATAAGAAWLGHRTVRPVHEIAAQAGAVDPDRPDGRLTIHADVEEYRSLVEVLNDMLSRLRGALAAQRRLIDDVAHELRTPLTAVQGTLEVGLRRRDADAGCRQILSSCLEDVERLNAINEAMLLLARLDAGHTAFAPARLDLAALVRTRVERLTARTGRSPAVEATGPADVSGDERLLTIALDQLLDNAVEHTPEGAEVRVTVGSAAGATGGEIIVDDAGPGIPDDNLDHLFERFYRADQARSREHGPGLGLTLVAAIVRLHRGQISACRSPLGGLRILCTFPSG